MRTLVHHHGGCRRGAPAADDGAHRRRRRQWRERATRGPPLPHCASGGTRRGGAPQRWTPAGGNKMLAVRQLNNITNTLRSVLLSILQDLVPPRLPRLHRPERRRWRWGCAARMAPPSWRRWRRRQWRCHQACAIRHASRRWKPSRCQRCSPLRSWRSRQDRKSRRRQQQRSWPSSPLHQNNHPRRQDRFHLRSLPRMDP